MNSDKKVIIAVHHMVYGVSSALRDYLISKKINRIYYIGLPLSLNNKYFTEYYRKGKYKKIQKIEKKISLGSFDYIYEFFFVLFKCFSLEKQDLFVGFDCLNALAGIFLKKLGRVEKVVLFTMDFSPIRFNNKFINHLYHQIEKISVKNVDEVWDVSPRMGNARAKFLNIPLDSYRRKIVEVGIWKNKIKKINFSEIKKHQLLFLGTLFEKQGIQLVLEAIPQILKKIPDFKFLVLGGGEYEIKLKEKTKKLNLTKFVEFKGWIDDREQLDKIIGESAVAVACYKPEKRKLYNFSYYGGAGKIKDYMSGGLPVILTDVSYNAKEIDEKKCGILVKYESSELTNAVVKLMKSEKILKEYRKNVFSYINEFDWNKVFDKAFVGL